MNPYLKVKSDRVSELHELELPKASEEDVQVLTKANQKPRDELALQKQILTEEYESLLNKKKDVERRKEELRRRRQKFDEYFEMNEKRKEKAFQKTSEDKRIIIELDKQLEKLKDQEEVEETERSKMVAYIQQYKGYREYLQKVVASSDGEFQEVNDLIRRYKNLKAVKQHSLAQKERLEREIESVDVISSKSLAEKSDDLLKSTMECSQAQEELDRLRFESTEMEEKLAKSQEKLSEKNISWIKLRMAIQSMHFKVGTSKYNRTPCLSNDPVKQLQKVAHFLIKWSEIVDDLQKEDVVSSVRAQASAIS